MAPNEGASGWDPNIGGFLGGAVHDGHLNTESGGNKALGTRALYHLGIMAGYQIAPVNNIEITARWKS